MMGDAASALVTQAALDYFEGWYDGDVARMDRALHPELVKRWAGEKEGTVLGPTRGKDFMLEATAGGGGREEGSGQEIEVEVTDVHQDIASVVVRSTQYREYLHLVRTPDGWKIVNAFWRLT